jgi:hypothetical protein
MAHRFVISGSIIMEPNSSESGGRQLSGNSFPKTGVSTKRICQQKVAATAFAASNAIQYPDNTLASVVMSLFRLGLPCATKAPPVMLWQISFNPTFRANIFAGVV